VLSVGVVTRDEPERREAHDKPGAFLFWVSSGKGTLEVGERSFHLRPGPRCWLLDLRQPRNYIPAPGRKLVTNGLRLAGPGVEAWLELLGAGGEFVFAQPGDLASIRRAQRHIIELVTRRPRAYEWQVHMLVTQILGLLLGVRRVLSEPARPAPRAVARVADAVTANPARKWQARELARVARISYSGLRTQFKQAQGETLREFLCRIRLDQARLRLGDPQLTCKDVARQLDFSSEHEFSHWFRRTAGVSPTQFRRMTQTRRA
jgi:AraC-like DNA-binding protein